MMKVGTSEVRRAECIARGARDRARAACKHVYLVGPDGEVCAGSPYELLSGIAALKLAPVYSFLVSDLGHVLSHRIPVANPSLEKMRAAIRRYELRQLGRAVREQQGQVH